jgi:hypothetical protein
MSSQHPRQQTGMATEPDLSLQGQSSSYGAEGLSLQAAGGQADEPAV